MKTNLPLLLSLITILSGCAHFQTTQTDERIDAKTQEKTKITTQASSWTFFDSKSNLAKWKATQSEKSQGAEVGGLAQETTGTNATTIVSAVVEAAIRAAAKSVIP